MSDKKDETSATARYFLIVFVRNLALVAIFFIFVKGCILGSL